MSKLTELTEAYLYAKDAAKRAKGIEDSTKEFLFAELERVGLKSIKTDRASVSIVKKPVYAVNERKVEDYLKEQPDLAIDEFYITTMDKKKVLAYADHQLKKTGEVIPGIEASETEYLMVREVKKENE